MPIEWIDDLRRTLDEQAPERARVAILATVDRSGAPHARAVICRRISDEGELHFVSDARSEKNAQVRGDGRVEVVFWLDSVQTQYRVAGEMRVTAIGQNEALRREAWQGLNDQTRAIFFWPTPGIAVAADDAYPRAVSADVAAPNNFELLVLRPSQVERLVLASCPHRRRRWRGDANWNGVEVNP